jgi:hypothetical protein
MKNKDMRGVFSDFIILSALLFAIALACLGARWLLFGKRSSEPTVITVFTEPLGSIYDGALSVGDALYDTRTKELLGYISDIRPENTPDGTVYGLTFEAKHAPRGDSLRTADLWFRYTVR